MIIILVVVKIPRSATANNIIEIIRTRHRFGDCFHCVTATANKVSL